MSRIQTTYNDRRALRKFEGRDGYRAAERNPLRLITWATDAVNIGGMVRTAEAFMAERVYAIREPKATAVGTDRWQPVVYGLDAIRVAIAEAQADGYTVVALEQTTDSRPLPCALPERMCLISGNEGSGVPASVLDSAALAIEIPQYGLVGSLNVVTATSIALYEWASQWAVAITRRAA